MARNKRSSAHNSRARKLRIEPLEQRAMLAGAPTVIDLNHSTPDSDPTNLLQVGSTVYFTTNDGTSGPQLWRTDGSEAGTVLVKQFQIGFDDRAISKLTNVSGTIYFSAADGMHGTELWKSDGTTAGTVLVADLIAGSNGSYPTQLTNVGGQLYFSARALGESDDDLWKSDGTVTGTVKIKSNQSPYAELAPRRSVELNGALVFRSQGALWRSDGTAAGTFELASADDVQPINVGGVLYFSRTGGLWASDGTVAGTQLTKGGVAGIQYLTNLNGALYFHATDGSSGRELWKSDGTTAGTVLVKDIRSGPSGSNPSYLTAVGNKLYFSATMGPAAVSFGAAMARRPAPFASRISALAQRESLPLY